MPLNIKLHRIHVEVGHFIHESRGKLVPFSAINKRFPDNHRVSDALWSLIEQRVVIESKEYPGSYQLSQEGAAFVTEEWEKLQAELGEGKRIPAVPAEDSPEDAKVQRELASAQKAREAEQKAEKKRAQVAKWRATRARKIAESQTA